ncbi:hypothetical protein A3F62_03650 [Candidatus Woesebacteria bacterium RIFCSPHIGHO2_12_FULL_44_11]|uniref:Polymerase nucleotidyl transferase domain-containing protein n=1 Tax=Candidatus Woesebacteria bacterium RIFCSPLOWO2_01_FULL_44_14 TaxID=1802525 RepID=A0A1F8C2L3_9BACT|nr:MAG: hypothetical protein A3F62_03650 [Candidatus Woesebacteria bacterium RIFCSPHIGHO2_12_FULL_44_11]OGM70079.1 MAG: hypothetical protein A2975_03315 [Candidatus Woesebacteria bacterium RIFCSPLOWO2_01_FULL_44_14]
MDLRPQQHKQDNRGISQIEVGLAAAIAYHNIFDYPLRHDELTKWYCGSQTPKLIAPDTLVASKDNFYFIAGRENLVLKRLFREKTSERKIKIAEAAARVLSKIPTVKMVAVTGSLAMRNARDDSDIDLMIITQKGTLWLTRAVAYLILKLAKFSLRTPGKKDEKDKLCTNIWLDETDLFWTKQNIFTAHEIAQVVSLVNKDNTHEKFLEENSWIVNYWPGTAQARQDIKKKKHTISRYLNIIISFANFLAFGLQYLYMKPKITREVVTPTRALFHPVDWSEEILSRFGLAS